MTRRDRNAAGVRRDHRRSRASRTSPRRFPHRLAWHARRQGSRMAGDPTARQREYGRGVAADDHVGKQARLHLHGRCM